MAETRARIRRGHKERSQGEEVRRGNMKSEKKGNSGSGKQRGKNTGN